jgi:hypothetical protein
VYDPSDVFVLGAVKLRGVRYAPWSSSKIPNLAEYRLVLLETVSLCALIEDNLRWDEKKLAVPGGYIPGYVPRDKEAERHLEQLGSRLKRVKEQLIKLLASRGHVVAILDHRGFVRPPQVSPLGWSPYEIAYTFEAGERVDVQDERFARYFAQVKHWSRLFDLRKGDWASPITGHFDTTVEFKSSNVAATKYGATIAAVLAFSTDDIPLSGRMICLPPPTECDIQQAVAIILCDFAGIEYDLPDPEWLSAVAVPTVDKIDAARERNMTRITQRQRAQERLDEAAARYAGPRRILFLPGMALQQACADVCSSIFGPVDDSIEDFIIPAEPDDVLVEVKGFDGSAKLGELSKVNTHIQEYETQREKTPNVVLLVSQHREQPLRERAPDTEYPDNVQKWAKTRQYALVSVQELFKAYCAWRTGRVSRETLIERMLSGVGATKLVMPGETWEPPSEGPSSSEPPSL